MNPELMKKYLKYFPREELDYKKIELGLGVRFSEEFKEFAQNTSFDRFNIFNYFNFDGNGTHGALQATKRLRKNMELPGNILLLEDDGTSLVFMKCFGDHEEVYWIAIEDGENFCEGKPLEYDYTFFPTFADFFKYLLDEEEKMRAENMK